MESNTSWLPLAHEHRFPMTVLVGQLSSLTKRGNTWRVTMPLSHHSMQKRLLFKKGLLLIYKNLKILKRLFKEKLSRLTY